MINFQDFFNRFTEGLIDLVNLLAHFNGELNK